MLLLYDCRYMLPFLLQKVHSLLLLQTIYQQRSWTLELSSLTLIAYQFTQSTSLTSRSLQSFRQLILMVKAVLPPLNAKSLLPPFNARGVFLCLNGQRCILTFRWSKCAFPSFRMAKGMFPPLGGQRGIPPFDPFMSLLHE